ncbi:alkaline ceramidase [Alsobacter sp. R-9]
MIGAGAAVVDITPPPGLLMAGFVARSEPATGVHDPLTARALAVGDTVLVVADVVALSPETSARIRRRIPLPDAAIVTAALHNHGGPVSTLTGLGTAADPVFLQRLEDGCVEAALAALARRRPARLAFGRGGDPGVARNRRHAGGLTDSDVPVLSVMADDGTPIAHLVSHACHPVVLGADNRLYTADYPAVVREAVETAHPGTVALFLTGCAGDANTGHTAHGSITTAANPARTFAEADRVGGRVAASALTAIMQPVALNSCSGAAADVLLHLDRREEGRLSELAAEWTRRTLSEPDPGRRALFAAWLDWSRTLAREPLLPLPTRVGVLRWGAFTLAALPGEIFAETGVAVRAALPAPCMVVGYAHECRGYLPPVGEYASGGYEVEEAHRYYGMPAGYAAGSAERLAEAVINLGTGVREA